MRKLYQFRYYGPKDMVNAEVGNINQPSNVTRQDLQTGAFIADYVPIIQLGIQTMPGVKFYLNNSHDPIIVGNTGIYELNVDNLTEITALNFDYASLELVDRNPRTAYIIIDILYGEMEGEQ